MMLISVARVNEGSHSFTYHPRIPQVEWIISTFTRQPRSVTALWLVLVSAEDRRLSWPVKRPASAVLKDFPGKDFAGCSSACDELIKERLRNIERLYYVDRDCFACFVLESFRALTLLVGWQGGILWSFLPLPIVPQSFSARIGGRIASGL